MTHFSIAGRRIGGNAPVFIIAELSANHLQDYGLAERTLRAMKKAGADAVKLQTYTPDTITLDCGDSIFTIRQGTIWDGKTLHQLYREAFMPWEWQPKLARLARRLELICFSSPFDRSAVDFLEGMRTPAYKVASFEITDIPLIEYIASKKKPVIISTGIADGSDIRRAMEACWKAGNRAVALLKCTSAYPAPVEDANLNAIPVLARRFKPAAIGISDHTPGSAVASAAVALGARIIEKHFILDRRLGGPDARFSLEPSEFSAMVRNVRETEKALGNASLMLPPAAEKSRIFRRSLFCVKDIGAGETFTEENIRSIRPGYGLHPRYLEQVLGKKARFALKKGRPLTWPCVQPGKERR